MVGAIAEVTVAVAEIAERTSTPAPQPAPPPPPPPPPAATTSISGIVLWNGMPGQGLPSITVVLQGRGLTLSASTDEDGRFELPGPLPRGEYVLFVDNVAIEGGVNVLVNSRGSLDVVVPAGPRSPAPE
jgi:hypothetical protein